MWVSSSNYVRKHDVVIGFGTWNVSMKPGTKKIIPRVFVEYIDLLTFSLSIEILLILSFHNKATKSHSLLHSDTWLFLWKEYGAKKSSFNKASFRRDGNARVQSSGFVFWIKLLSNFWKVKGYGNGLLLFGHESNFTNFACTKLIKKKHSACKNP